MDQEPMINWQKVPRMFGKAALSILVAVLAIMAVQYLFNG
jgi:hypothetical protein